MSLVCVLGRCHRACVEEGWGHYPAQPVWKAGVGAGALSKLCTVLLQRLVGAPKAPIKAESVRGKDVPRKNPDAPLGGNVTRKMCGCWCVWLPAGGCMYLLVVAVFVHGCLQMFVCVPA
eukprot:scaffold136191_cov21-Tisochrysis_lutea.AAC.1